MVKITYQFDKLNYRNFFWWKENHSRKLERKEMTSYDLFRKQKKKRLKSTKSAFGIVIFHKPKNEEHSFKLNYNFTKCLISYHYF